MFAIVICMCTLIIFLFCVECINGRRYVGCGECYVASNECDEPTTSLVQTIVAHCFEGMYFGCFGFLG